MGIELHLARVAEDDAPVAADALDVLAAIARDVLEDDQAVRLSPDGKDVWCELPGGTAAINAIGGTIPFDDIDDETVWFAYEFAKASDMAIWLDAEPNIILTKTSQRKRVPESWLNAGQKPPVIRTAARLNALLDDIYEDGAGQSQNNPGQPKPGEQVDEEPPWPSSKRGRIYIEARDKERVGKFLSTFGGVTINWVNMGMEDVPDCSVAFIGREIRTPAGLRMFVPRLGGEYDEAVAFVRKVAAMQNRAFAVADEHKMLVFDSGERIPLDQCTVYASW